MTGSNPSLSERIREARTLSGVSPEEPLTAYPSIGAVLREHADQREDQTYLVAYTEDGQRREYTYAEFFEQVSRAAGVLRSHGVRRGDRIAILSFNAAEVVIQYFAIWLSGAVAVPLNADENDRRLSYVLSNSGASLIFVRDDQLQRLLEIRKEIPALATVIQVGQRVSADLPHYQSELARQPERFVPDEEPGPEDDALIVYTSGATGNPKGVALTHYNLLADGMAIAEWHQLADDQRMMCVLPLHHVNGIVVTLIAPLYAGAGVVLNQRFHPDRFFERIGAERVSIVSVVPTILQFLLHSNLAMEAYKLQYFRHFICGAGPLTVELATKFEQKFKMPIVHGYGLSETTCCSCFLPLDLVPAEHRAWLSKHGFPSIGVPLPVNQVAIHDAEGNELGEGERGEIVIRGHNVMRGYLGDDAANEQAFTHGWFRSGDEGFWLPDEAGRQFFFITGRINGQYLDAEDAAS